MLLLQPHRYKSYLYVFYGLVCSRFARHYSGNLFWFIFRGYLDISVHHVSFCNRRKYWLPVLGSPIRKSWSNNASYQLLQAYRRLVRPSSDIRVKASTLCYMVILTSPMTINHFLLDESSTNFVCSDYIKEQNNQNIRKKIRF